MDAKKVLVVDDSPTELKLMSEPFVLNGYGVVTATDGEQALQVADAERPALMVLDVIMEDERIPGLPQDQKPYHVKGHQSYSANQQESGQ